MIIHLLKELTEEELLNIVNAYSNQPATNVTTVFLSHLISCKKKGLNVLYYYNDEEEYLRSLHIWIRSCSSSFFFEDKIFSCSCLQTQKGLLFQCEITQIFTYLLLISPKPTHTHCTVTCKYFKELLKIKPIFKGIVCCFFNLFELIKQIE